VQGTETSFCDGGPVGAGSSVPQPCALSLRQVTRVVTALIGVACFAVRSGLAQRPTAPPIVQRGLQAYRSGGPDSAVRVWLANSPIAHDSNALSSVVALRQIQDAYGTIIGDETLAVNPIGSHVLRVYVVILYQKGPLYVRFECYQATSEWLVSAFLFNPRPEAILPVDLLDH